MSKKLAQLVAAVVFFQGGYAFAESDVQGKSMADSDSPKDIWSGPYFGVGAGFENSIDRSTEYEAGTSESNGYTGLNSDSNGVVNLHIGYGWAVNRFVFSLEARIQGGTSESKDFQMLDGEEDPLYSTSYSSNFSKQLVTRLGYKIHESALGYMVLGLSAADYTRGYYSPSAPDGEFFSGTDNGKIIGLGYERRLSKRLGVRLEVSRSFYDEVIITPQSAWSSLDDIHNLEKTSISIALSQYF